MKRIRNHLPALDFLFELLSMIVGNFTSKNKELARKLIRECLKTAERYNSEIYLDSVIQIALEFGHKVSSVGLDKFLRLELRMN